MNVLLCGLPFTGKTTYGTLLGLSLNRPWLDTDRIVEKHYAVNHGHNLTVREIVLLHGRDYFQTLERIALESLIGLEQHVISLGGNTLHSSENRQLIQALGMVIYLKTHLDIIMKRVLSQAQLPSYVDAQDPEGSLRNLIKEREPIYQEAAHAIVELDQQMGPEEVLMDIKIVIGKINHGF